MCEGALTGVQVVCKHHVQMRVPVLEGSQFNSTTKESLTYWIMEDLSHPSCWKQSLKLKFESRSIRMLWAQGLGILESGDPFISVWSEGVWTVA